jgi:hypothetical protein
MCPGGDEMTKVFAVNGSNRKGRGNMEKLLTPFLEGMKEAGAEVELVYSRDLDIEDCLGDFDCWNKHPGVCIQKDEMQEMYPMLRASDVLVLGIPRYIPMPAPLQAFINRLCPLIEPVLEAKDGRTVARFQEDVRIKRIVLVAVSGWWEVGNMDLLVEIVKEIAKDTGTEFAGALLRPHAYEMARPEAADVLEAAHRLGCQLISKGRMSPDDLAVVSRPLVSWENDLERSNRGYQETKRRTLG